MQSSEKLGYFLAGALLPTLAYYILLGFTKSNYPSNDTADTALYDEDSDEDLHEQLGKPTSKDPREWGLRDSPYKVRLFEPCAECTKFLALAIDGRSILYRS